ALAELLWTPSEDADENLRREGVPEARIERVGNIMIDSFELLAPRIRAARVAARYGLRPLDYAVVTLHRPSNVDRPETLARIAEALVAIAAQLPVVFPVHPRTRARLAEFGLERAVARAPALRLVEPLSYVEFMSLVLDARFVLTD